MGPLRTERINELMGMESVSSYERDPSMLLTHPQLHVGRRDLWS
jgi:hypothetical protein